MQIVLCCVVCSYLDIKQIEVACLLFGELPGGKPEAHFLVVVQGQG